MYNLMKWDLLVREHKDSAKKKFFSLIPPKNGLCHIEEIPTSFNYYFFSISLVV